MSSGPRDAPEVVIKNLIRDAWEKTRLDADAFTPSIHHGWVDPDSDIYEITVSNPTMFAVYGGETGYSGISSDGTPRQDWSGTVSVNVWASRDWAGTDGVTLNPRKATHLMAWMVEEIIREHSNGTNAQGEQTDLETMAPIDTRRFNPEADEDPPVWRYMVRVGFTYRQ